MARPGAELRLNICPQNNLMQKFQQQLLDFYFSDVAFSIFDTDQVVCNT
jgi:hypothetical protein